MSYCLHAHCPHTDPLTHAIAWNGIGPTERNCPRMGLAAPRMIVPWGIAIHRWILSRNTRNCSYEYYHLDLTGMWLHSRRITLMKDCTLTELILVSRGRPPSPSEKRIASILPSSKISHTRDCPQTKLSKNVSSIGKLGKYASRYASPILPTYRFESHEE